MLIFSALFSAYISASAEKKKCISMKLNINDWRSNNQSKTLEEIIHLDNLLQEFNSGKSRLVCFTGTLGVVWLDLIDSVRHIINELS